MPSLSDLLRHLEAQSGTLVHLRTGAPPVFWRANERLPDHAGFGILRRDAIKRLIPVPLSDEQLAAFRRRNFVAVALGVRDLGAFHFEAYVQKTGEEIVITSAERDDPWTLFRDQHDLLAEARRAPEDPDVYWNLATAFIDAGDYQLAWHAFEKAAALVPDDGTIQLQIGKMLGHELYRVDDAIAALARAAALPDPVPEVHVEWAVMLRSSGRLGDAEIAVRRGLEVAPDQPRLLEALGVLLLELDRAGEAIPVLERSLEVHGADGEIEELLARARSR